MRLILLAASLIAMLGAARAEPTASASTGHARASLLAETTGWTPGQPLRLGLRLSLAPGWHTYWSNPGDAGLAPDVAVALDGGKPQAASLQFPAPHRLPTGPLMGYGYEGEVLLPFRVPLPAASGPVHVAVRADWLVCAAVCVPETADLALTLPQTPQAVPSADAAAFRQADQAMPRPSPFTASLSQDGALRIAGDGLDQRTVASAWFIPASPGLIDQDAAQALSVADGALTLALHPQPGLPPRGTLSGVLAIRDQGGQETDLAVTAPRGPPSPPASPPAGLPRLLLLALAGGLVLNLMPCVFPVLAMKAIALGRHGPGHRGQLRASALLYTGGILATFLLIGILTLVLRSAGSEAGWGFQFQSPGFVAAIAWLLFAVGLNLMGLFEVGAGLAGAGQGLASRGGALGDVMTGVLAVLVATPCTAPFMGAAIAAALAGPKLAGIAIFAALGLGLAAPSLVLGFVPGASRLMPRPGAWMIVVRQVLAFPMFGAAVWLLWVLSEETGPSGVLAGLSGLLLIGFGGWLHGLLQRSPPAASRRRALDLVALAAVLAALSMLPGLTPDDREHVAGANSFSPARLAALRHGGRPVFVDMSAAWCVTCLVNERLALAPAAVRGAFASSGITLLRGDWTRRDAGITDFLRRFGRDGVPLYVFFPAHDGAPRILPQILTPGLVLESIAARA